MNLKSSIKYRPKSKRIGVKQKVTIHDKWDRMRMAINVWKPLNLHDFIIEYSLITEVSKKGKVEVLVNLTRTIYSNFL